MEINVYYIISNILAFILGLIVNYYLSKIDLTNLSGRNWFDDDGENHYESASTIIENIRRQAVKFLPESKSDCYLFFDTETTGIPTDYNAPSSDTSNWPRLVQLAWILSDENGNIIHTGNLIVKPIGFTIPIEASRIHGITTEIAKEKGTPIKDVIEKFMEDVYAANTLVGHNIDFDKKVINTELIRLRLNNEYDDMNSYDFMSKESICTMKESILFCEIPSRNYYHPFKQPKLQELHKKLFGYEFEDAHNSMSDVTATLKCFKEMRKRGLI